MNDKKQVSENIQRIRNELAGKARLLQKLVPMVFGIISENIRIANVKTVENIPTKASP